MSIFGEEISNLKKDYTIGEAFSTADNIEKQSTYSIASDTARLLDDCVAQKTRNLHLQAGARRVLACLAIRDGVSQLDLIRQTHLKAPTISLIVQKMEQDGLITRKTDDLDMRLTRVYLTDAGSAVHAEIRNEIAVVEDEAMAGFTDEERDMFRSFIKRIYLNLDDLAMERG